MQEIYLYFSIIFLLLFSAIFSGSETAFFSLDKQKKKNYLNGPSKNSLAAKLIKKPNYLLVTLLFGNMLVNIFLSNMTEKLIQESSHFAGLTFNTRIILSIIIATFIILLFGEALPKVLAMNKPHLVIRLLSPVIYSISVAIHPIKVFLNFITKLSRRIFSSGELHDTITGSELSTIVNVSYKEGVIDRDEVKLIQNVLKFAQMEVSSIMTPRTQLFCLEKNSSVDKLIYEAKKAGYSKIPVYEENKDNIVGMIYMRDVLSVIHGEEKKPKDITPFIRDLHYIPEGKSLLQLLKEFKEKRLKVAVVIDEYGGTAGIVTLDDLIHRITGKFYEEETYYEGRKVVKIREDEYLAQGDATLEDFFNISGVELQSEEFETIGGYLMSHLDRIPRAGDKFHDGKLYFRVAKMDNHKIEQVVIKTRQKLKKPKSHHSEAED